MTAILDNIKKVSQETLDTILTTQIRWIKKRGGADFNELMVDSTAVTTNSAWPTDSKIIIGLLVRIWRELDRMTLTTEKDAAQILEILADVNKLDFQINMVGGKKNSQNTHLFQNPQP